MSEFVRARLKGINEEERNTMSAPRADGGAPTPVVLRETIVRLEGYDLFTHVAVPAELIGDAKIGDEFEIHFRRVRE